MRQEWKQPQFEVWREGERGAVYPWALTSVSLPATFSLLHPSSPELRQVMPRFHDCDDDAPEEDPSDVLDTVALSQRRAHLRDQKARMEESMANILEQMEQV